MNGHRPPAIGVTQRARTDGVLAITDAEFTAFRELIRRVAGISMSEMKRSLLCSRLGRRLRHHGFSRFSEYYDFLLTRDPERAELDEMVNCITTNKTQFFREPHHFDFLRDRLFPEMVERARRGEGRKLRVWSAGCSTGEEPYSIAITTLEQLESQSAWNIKILASDIDTDVLARAEAGIYSVESLGGLSREKRERWFQPAPDGHGNALQARLELQELVIFRQINFIESHWPINTAFDVIFCRNVTIYFDRETQLCLYERLARQLRPGGYLVAGHSENLSWLQHLFTPVGRTVYQVRTDLARATKSTPSAGKSKREACLPGALPRREPVLKQARIISGGVFSSREPAAVSTVLGSCVAVCLDDPVSRVGGMNHFMLPERTRHALDSARYGVHAMELLINEIMALGGQRQRLRARLFGAANVLRSSSPGVAAANARFAVEFLDREGIPLLERRLGGAQPLRVTFFTHTGLAIVQSVGEERERVLESEARLRLEVEQSLLRPNTEKVTLF